MGFAQNPPEVPPCPRGSVFIQRGAARRHEKLLWKMLLVVVLVLFLEDNRGRDDYFHPPWDIHAERKPLLQILGELPAPSPLTPLPRWGEGNRSYRLTCPETFS